MTKQGQQNRDENAAQIKKRESQVDVELGSEFQVGNNEHQSQKKSGRQINKK